LQFFVIFNCKNDSLGVIKIPVIIMDLLMVIKKSCYSD
jgi:hypothetical protein